MTCDWVPGCPHPARHRIERASRPGLLLHVCDRHFEDAEREGYGRYGPAEDQAVDNGELRRSAREMLDAEAAFRSAPTMQASDRLERARRRLARVLHGVGR